MYEEAPNRFENCYLCHKPLPPMYGGKERRRFRKCRSCVNMGTKKNRMDDPVRHLHFKWRTLQSKRPLNDDVKHLVSVDVVRNVFERCGRRSALSGATDHKRLCVASKVKHPQTEDDLVVVTTGDAVLVMPKERAQDVRAVVQELERRKMEPYL